MSYLVLARKYRPQTFDEVIEQGHVTRTLSNAISAGRVAHAVLFSGPRGTGKTTVARIFAKSMNCEEGPTPTPCNECRSCREITSGHAVDVYEIDGASNNSVDQVRELRENIKYMPAHSRSKIYIIDEVHMLSISAFNALLKTLEEPPSHVMFIFATTEPQKIPITILSRCQRHEFRRINMDSITRHMVSLGRREGFDIHAESLNLIAREAGGSMRDALSLLDQVMTYSSGTITHEQVLDILGVIDRKIIYDLSDSVLRGDIPAVLDVINDVYDRGHNVKKLHADLLEHIRNLLVAGMGQKVRKLIDLPAGEIDQLMDQSKQVSAAALQQIFDSLFKEEAAVRLSIQPKLALEMAFVRMMSTKPALPIEDLIDRLDDLRTEMHSTPGQNPGSTNESTGGTGLESSLSSSAANAPMVNAASSAPRPPETQADVPGTAFDTQDDLAETWQKMCNNILQHAPSLAANLAKCRLKNITEDHLEIEVNGNDFTLKMIQRDKNKDLLKKICTEFLGKEKNIVFSASSQNKNEKVKKKRDNQLKKEAIDHPLVADSIEIFNGTLVDVKIL
jgi:DNA polymerase-3 subunit gamma/tau